MRNKRYFSLNSTLGFTLIELLITMGIAAVLISLAFPSFREINIRMNVTSNTNDIVGALNLARSEAVKRGANVTLASVSGGADWSTGWVVKTATESLRVYPALTSNYTVKAAAGAGGADQQIVFSGRGDLGVVSNFGVSVCRPDHNPTNSRLIQVAGTGVVTTKSPALSCT